MKNTLPVSFKVVITDTAIEKSAKTKFPTHQATCPLAFAIREAFPAIKALGIGLTGILVENAERYDFPTGVVYGVTPEKVGDVFELTYNAV
jgi:hypothetical protein